MTRLTQRAAGTRTTASIQKAMSVATGAWAPSTKTMTMSSSQLADVSAVTPFSDSVMFIPPMLRPGSRYRPKVQSAASQIRRQKHEGEGAAARIELEGREEATDDRHVVERPGDPDGEKRGGDKTRSRRRSASRATRSLDGRLVFTFPAIAARVARPV